MKLASLFSTGLLMIAGCCLHAQNLSISPARLVANESVKITIDLSQMPIFSENEDLYLWAWTDNNAHKAPNGSWQNSNEAQKLTKLSASKYGFEMIPTNYFGLKSGEFAKVQFLVKTKNGQKQTSDLLLLVDKTVAETEAYLKSLEPQPDVYQPFDFKASKVKPLTVAPSVLNFEKMEVKLGNAFLSIDPRIELTYTLAILGGYPLINPNAMPYKSEILAHFERFRNDPFPQQFIRKVMAPNIDDATFFMLNLNEKLEPMPSINQHLVEKLGGIDSVQAMANTLKLFCERANYAQFFNSQKAFFQTVLQSNQYAFKDYDDIKLIEKYYGIKQKSYSIVINTLFAMGHFGVISTDYEGNSNIYAVLQPEAVTNGIPFIPANIGQYSLLFHEFSHSFVNPLVDKYVAEVGKYSDLYKPIAQSMSAQAYQNWHVTVKEHIVRAVTCRLGTLKYGNEMGRIFFEDMEKAHRFIYVKPLIEKLKIYEQNRPKYQDFASFFPELLQVFKDIKPEDIVRMQREVEEIRTANTHPKIPKIGDVNFDQNCVFIISTHEKENQQTVNQFVEAFNTLLTSRLRVLTDEEALKTDLSAYHLLVVGTVEGNLFTQKYIKNVPIHITEKGITTSKFIAGNDLQIMLSWVSPFNKDNAMVFISAQKADQLKEYFYSPFKESYHFWIARNLVTIESGSFFNAGGLWIPGN
jgi:Domain of unknown function (DUF4932)